MDVNTSTGLCRLIFQVLSILIALVSQRLLGFVYMEMISVGVDATGLTVFIVTLATAVTTTTIPVVDFWVAF